MSKKPTDNSKTGAVSEDENALWQRVAESVTPINKSDRDSDRVRIAGDETPLPETNNSTPRASPPSSPSAREPSAPRAKPRVAQAKPTQAPEPKGLGQSTVRKLRSGRISIEARLDLHGMRQSEAHGALRHFLYASQRRGLRWVIVITGKGGRSPRTDSDDSYFDGLGRQAEPGVLRRNVPRWLQEPDLRSIVIGFQTAAPQHGGEGALYVNLRRQDRVK